MKRLDKSIIHGMKEYWSTRKTAGLRDLALRQLHFLSYMDNIKKLHLSNGQQRDPKRKSRVANMSLKDKRDYVIQHGISFQETEIWG